MWPTDPIAAVVHADPYPYYEALTRQPIQRDATLGSWVAASAADVTAVLEHPAARVRPVDEPVPAHLVGSAAGEVFGRLVRMTDGADQASLKSALEGALGALGPDAVAEASVRTATILDEAGDATLEQWMYAFPVGVVARLVGIDVIELHELVAAARALAACFAPGAAPERVGPADEAARTLTRLAARAASQEATGVASVFARSLAAAQRDDVIANVVGLFFQTFDATAGLIGSTINRLAGGDLGAPVKPIVAEVARRDPSVHNTRRFFHADAVVAGELIARGDNVLLVLAAANCDPAGDGLSFGAGGHRCPARQLAPAIALAAVEALCDRHPERLATAVATGYRPSPNVRIPTFA